VTGLVAIHRWLGVALCLFMAAWFASGAVLIYVPFPTLQEGDRLGRASDVDASLVALAPVDAIQAIPHASQPIDRVRLIARDGRPLYVVQARGAPVSAIWADDGSAAAVQTQETARSVALQFSEIPVGRIDGPLDFDQWTVHQGFDDARPYFRVHIDDTEGTVLYVSQRSGEVLQRTQRNERAWNYVGAVVHWIYPTVLRRHWAAWDQVVWWLSLVGIALALIGLWLGIDRMLIALRGRRKLTMYRGWMKWHHLLGLTAGLFVLTWILSGWLSMDHGRIFSTPDPTAKHIDRFRGITLGDAAKYVGVEFIHSLGSFRELEIKALAGSPVAILRSGKDQRIYFVGSDERFTTAAFPRPLIVAAVERAWPEFKVQAVEAPAVDDVYRQVRQSELPESTIRVKLDDPDDTWVHVDAASGDIVSVMDRGRRLYRWLYHGLHSLDFPGLVNHRPLWDIVILSLLGGGFSFSVTGAFLGIKRLKRSVTKGNGAK
jgi:uncharacterized iron-regulated membrane protein